MALTTEQTAAIRLFRTPGVGPVTFAGLIKQCGTAARAIEMLPELCRRHRRRAMTPPDLATVQREQDALHRLGGRFVFRGDEEYPKLLNHLEDAPPVLAVLGNPAHLKGKFVALVGNRNASAAGMALAGQMAADLCAARWGVVSGLARGIDTASHQGALRAGGVTVAVLAGGVDHIYPPENKNLYKQIQEQGCIISEMPLGMVPLASHFPRRNRLISGMARGVGVVEASRHSGSLITATYALEQGRDVFAVPGSPADPRASGPNHLLRQGAHVLESAADFLSEFGHELEYIPKQAPVAEARDLFTDINDTAAPDEAESTLEEAPPTDVAALLSTAPVAIDELIRRSGLSQADVTIALTELDIAGRLHRLPGGFVALRAS